jgi:short-subunit dehydrogenase
MAEKIISEKNPKSNIIIEHYYLDLGSKKSIQQFSETVHQRFLEIDYLVNNAGVSLIP